MWGCLFSSDGWAALAARVTATDLRCEYLVDPLGVDVGAPRFCWKLVTDSPGTRGIVQSAYQVLVATSPEVLAGDQGDVWDSGRVESNQSTQVVYRGKPLQSGKGYWWKVRAWAGELKSDGAKGGAEEAGQWSKSAHWEMGLLRPEDWTATWIEAPPASELQGEYGPVPILRKEFSLPSKTIVKARLYVTALGLYEMHLNGQRVGDHVFAPDWTDYGKRVRYQVYDVTSLVKPGGNALAGMLGNGWYCGHIGNGGFQAWGKVPALFCQLVVTYDDGSEERIVTDGSWKVHSSPITASDFMLGEDCDARLEIAGWDEPGLDEGDWSTAHERAEAARSLNGQVDQPVRAIAELRPKSVSEPAKGQWTYDFGQNMVGFVRLKVSAPAGTKITLRHAEMLNEDGSLYVTNLRRAASVDTYICKGEGVETWQPRFTFHGFRYLEITGLPQAPTIDDVTGIVVASDIPRTGEFACSNLGVNQLQSNIQWGMRGNYLAVPTDCPQRDERMGWMGDAQVFVRTAAYNGDVAAFFTKWLLDVDDAQRADGAFTDVCPSPHGKGGGNHGVPGWADAGVICPWSIYLMYGDRRILAEHLPAMKRWVDWCQAHSTELIRDRDRGNDYGDWLSQGENTPKDLIGTAYFAHSADLVAQASRVVGDNAAAERYEELFEEIKAAFNKRYVDADGHVQGGTQCGYALALRFNLLPEELREKAGQYLVDDVSAHGDHLTTGFYGREQFVAGVVLGRACW